MELVNKWPFARTSGHLLVLTGDYGMYSFAPMITHGELRNIEMVDFPNVLATELTTVAARCMMKGDD